MKVLVSGSSGLVGTAVVAALAAAGHGVTRLVRRPARDAGEASWDPTAGRIDAERLEGHDAAVHLAGENVAARRWTERQKALIRDSRVRGTQLLCAALSRLSAPPPVLVGASAIGYYGSRGDAVLTESSAPGADFLAQVCIPWEAAYGELAERGTRLVVLRIGVVLGARGGALARMLPLFRLGLGGRLGSGRQYVSWIALDDLVAVVERALADGRLAGPCNATAPRPVTNAELTRALGRVLRRPTALAVPAPALRCLLGEMADGLLLSSTRVIPERLQRQGFEFRFPEIEGALRHVLAAPAA